MVVALVVIGNQRYKIWTPDEDMVVCPEYVSRTGNSWDRCFYYHVKDNKVYIYKGAVKKLYEIMTFNPMTLSDLRKPISRKPANMCDSLLGFGISALEATANCLDDNRNLMLHSTHNGFEIFIYKKYDIKVRATEKLFKVFNDDIKEHSIELYEIEGKLEDFDKYMGHEIKIKYGEVRGDIKSYKAREQRSRNKILYVYLVRGTKIIIEKHYPEQNEIGKIVKYHEYKEELKLNPEKYYLMIDYTRYKTGARWNWKI